MDKKIFSLIVFACMMASPAFAIQVTHVSDYNTYSTGFLSSVTGRQIDLSTAGVTFSIGSPTIGSTNGHNGRNFTYIVLDSPDTTTNGWWVYVRLMNDSSISVLNPDGFYLNPPNIRFSIFCGSSGAVYNVTSFIANSTWRTDYTLFFIDSSDTRSVPYALPSINGNPLTSPVGVDLLSKSFSCYFEVFPDDWNNNPSVYALVSVWNENPDRNAVCNIDPAVASIQSTTLGIVDINFQIWSMLFNLFSIVIILLAVFGIPVMLIKLIRWIFDEAKKMTGRRKVF